MKPFMFSHAETAQKDVRTLTSEEIALIAGGNDMLTVDPSHEDTQVMCLGSDGAMSRDGIKTDTRG